LLDPHGRIRHRGRGQRLAERRCLRGYGERLALVAVADQSNDAQTNHDGQNITSA
jgi:hypothetical protein